MTLYSKWFNTHSEYEAYKNGQNYILPNVSICYNDLDVHYEKEFDPFNGYEYVDLGLPSGTLWAKCNIGATNESDYGLYFAWGETTGYTAASQHQFNWANYSYSDNNGSTMTKYNSTDGKTSLDLEDDAAHINMGGNWIMPSEDDINELVNNTTHIETTVNNVLGMQFTSKTNNNTLFFPYAGFIDDNTQSYVTAYAYLWSSTRSEGFFDIDSDSEAFQCFIHKPEFDEDINYYPDPDMTGSIQYERYTGFSIRGVIHRN